MIVFAGQMDNLADDAAHVGWAGRIGFDELIWAANKLAQVFKR